MSSSGKRDVDSNLKRKRRNKNTSTSTGKGKGSSKWLEEQERYYERLLHAAQKGLRKQAKQVRNFECQKLIRKLKDNGNDNHSKKESLYESFKQLDLELVVQECLRRLGILHLNPKQKGDDEDDEASSNALQVPIHDSSLSSSSSLVERLLKHKRMQSSLEEWNDKVTEYRRWSLQKQEQFEGNHNKFDTTTTSTAATNAKKKQKKNKKEKQQSGESGEEPAAGVEKSLFLTLGGGGNDDDDEEEEDPYQNPYGPGQQLQQPKKNRKGQRARRAKAMAIQAKKEGKTHRAKDSFNWRSKKNVQQQQDDGDGNRQHRNRMEQHPNKNYASTNSHNGGAPKQQQSQQQEESLHPSWAAAKKETTGIVQFKGTKITFD